MSSESTERRAEEKTCLESSVASVASPSATEMNLSTLDKIKRFFFSKEEWEAYLLERLEEEKQKKDGKSCSSVQKRREEREENKNVISWIKTVFPLEEDANSFLKSQLEILEEEKQQNKQKKSQRQQQ